MSVAAHAATADPTSFLPAGSLLATPRPATRVIAVLAEKGGGGKTTTAINLAAAFVEADHECLLVDMDAQGAGATGTLGVRQPLSEHPAGTNSPKLASP